MKKFIFFINQQQYEVAEQNLNGLQLKTIGGIPVDSNLFLKVNTNNGEKLIGNNDIVDLGLPGTEHFYSESNGNSIVQIRINDNPYEIHRGRKSVAEIKTTGNIPIAHDLVQIIDEKLTPLDDNASITIKGGEVFLSHPKDGSSS